MALDARAVHDGDMTADDRRNTALILAAMLLRDGAITDAERDWLHALCERMKQRHADALIEQAAGIDDTAALAAQLSPEARAVLDELIAEAAGIEGDAGRFESGGRHGGHGGNGDNGDNGDNGGRG